MGLRENADKMKVMKRSGSDLDDATLQAGKAEQVRVLGVDFGVQRKDRESGTCRARVQQAAARAAKIKHLHFLGYGRVKAATRSYVMAKAAWGWWRSPPDRGSVRAATQARRQALKLTTAQVSSDLQRMLAGHDLDLPFAAAAGAVNAHMAAQARRTTETTAASGRAAWFTRVRSFVEKYGGRYEEEHHRWSFGDLVWTAGIWAEVKGKVMHLLREGWRREVFDRFANSGRGDARGLCERERAYDERLIKRVRQMHDSSRTSRGMRHVLQGGAVSFATCSRWRKEPLPDVCEDCRQAIVPSWEHIAWDCAGQLFAEGRPRRPGSSLARRLGWPTTTVMDDTAATDAEWACLEHLARVRGRVLDRHYGRP
jgi:hypothetical protein